MFTVFDKAIVAFIVPVVIQLLVHFGIPNADSDQTVQVITDIVTGAVTLAAVYLTPNKGVVYEDA
jgi:hypothetical protein